MTFEVDSGPLKKRRLLSTFFISARLLLSADIGYLDLNLLSAWQSYHIFQVYNFVYQNFFLVFQRGLVGLLVGSPCADQLLSPSIFGRTWSV